MDGKEREGTAGAHLSSRDPGWGGGSRQRGRAEGEWKDGWARKGGGRKERRERGNLRAGMEEIGRQKEGGD